MISNLYPVQGSRCALTRVAWFTTILMSTLPDILLVELTGSVPTGLVLIKMSLLFILAVMAWFWKRLSPLRNLFIVLFAFFALNKLRPLINFTIPGLQALFGSNVFDVRMQAEQTGKLVVSLAMIVILLGLRYKRSEFFLTRGYLKALIDPVPLLGFPKPDPWPKFGLQWGTYIAAAMAVVLYFGLRPGGNVFLKAMPILPSILFYAALNAFNEEITYRSPLLATLEPVGGSKNALWMAAYFFGISHYFGIPGGILGGIASIFMGWILAKAMLETRGLFWSWWIHWLSDIVIFLFITFGLID